MIDKVWNTDRWKRVSLAGKRNRCTEVDGQMSAHSGGSLSFDHHELRMIGEINGDPVSQVKVYKRTHRKKGISLGEESSQSVESEYITRKRILLRNSGQTLMIIHWKLIEIYGRSVSEGLKREIGLEFQKMRWEHRRCQMLVVLMLPTRVMSEEVDERCHSSREVLV